MKFILGLGLFNLSLSDLELVVSRVVTRFADYTKLFRMVKTEANYEGDETIFFGFDGRLCSG